MPRKSQGPNSWHSALFQSSLSSLSQGSGGSCQLVVLTLGQLAWALVHKDWCKSHELMQVSAYLQGALHITDTTTHGETQVLTEDHKENYSLPLARPDSSVSSLMSARAGELRKGSPAKEPRAWHTHEKVTLTCVHQGS